MYCENFNKSTETEQKLIFITSFQRQEVSEMEDILFCHNCKPHSEPTTVAHFDFVWSDDADIYVDFSMTREDLIFDGLLRIYLTDDRILFPCWCFYETYPRARIKVTNICEYLLLNTEYILLPSKLVKATSTRKGVKVCRDFAPSVDACQSYLFRWPTLGVSTVGEYPGPLPSWEGVVAMLGEKEGGST